jgi:hypothetical protein
VSVAMSSPYECLNIDATEAGEGAARAEGPAASLELRTKSKAAGGAPALRKGHILQTSDIRGGARV